MKIIDLRSSEMRKSEGYVVGSIQMDAQHVKYSIEEAVPDKSELLLVHCWPGCTVSGYVSDLLKELGYENVENTRNHMYNLNYMSRHNIGYQLGDQND